MIETLTFDDLWLMGKGTYQAYRTQINRYGPYLTVALGLVGIYALLKYIEDDDFFYQTGGIAESHQFNPQGLPSDLKFNEKEVHCDLLHNEMIANSHRLNFAPSKQDHMRLKREIDLMREAKKEQNCRTK